MASQQAAVGSSPTAEVVSASWLVLLLLIFHLSRFWVLICWKDCGLDGFEQVGNAFVHQYYLILHQSPELVYRFYQDSSKLGRPEAEGLMSSITTMQVSWIYCLFWLSISISGLSWHVAQTMAICIIKSVFFLFCLFVWFSSRWQ